MIRIFDLEKFLISEVRIGNSSFLAGYRSTRAEESNLTNLLNDLNCAYEDFEVDMNTQESKSILSCSYCCLGRSFSRPTLLLRSSN